MPDDDACRVCGAPMTWDGDVWICSAACKYTRTRRHRSRPRKGRPGATVQTS